MMTIGEARATLRQRINEREEASCAAAAAREAEERGRQLVSAVEAELARLVEHEAQIIAGRAAQLRDWAAGRGEQPTPDTEDEPVVRGQTCAEIKARVEAARQALELLVQEREGAEKEFARASARVERAATDICYLAGEAMAAELEAARLRVIELSDELHGLARIWLAGSRDQVSPKRLSAAVLTAIERVSAIADDWRDRHGLAARIAAGEGWLRAWRALLADADAPLSGEAAGPAEKTAEAAEDFCMARACTH
jgi:hypothetical protein